ncbi:MAG: hypothetical protein R3Y59_00450 [bacterium]
MKNSLDKIWIGLALGVIMPVVFGWFFIESSYSGTMSFSGIINFMSSNSMIIKFIFIAILPNMGGVFVLNSLEMWNACKGMFAAIGLYILICGTFLIINAF